MRMKPSALVSLLACLIIFLPNNSDGRMSPEENPVKCSISLEESRLSKGRAAYVLIRLENVSDKNVRFWAEYIFNIKTMSEEVTSRNYERVGDRYYSGSGLINKDDLLVLVPKDLKKTIRINRNTSRFPNEEIRLSKGEVKQIRVDLAQLLWADGMSGFWPGESFFELIPKGKYKVSFKMFGEKVKAISNQVDVQID